MLKPDIGSSEIVHRALRRGALDMYPEYIGVLLSEVAQDTDRPPSDAAAYDAAQAFERRSGFTLLAQTPFADANALAVKPAFARRHRLSTIADLRRLKGTVKSPRCRSSRPASKGSRGCEAVRPARLEAVDAEGSERYAMLDGGEVDVASVFTSEGQLAGDDYLVLWIRAAVRLRPRRARRQRHAARGARTGPAEGDRRRQPRAHDGACAT